MLSVDDAAAELIRRRKARASLTGFAKYVQPEDQQPADHHMLILAALDAVIDGTVGNLIIMMPPGSAKALALDTPIPTPQGWKAMGELAVGDEVFDERGNPCRVTWVSPVWRDRPVYRVRTDCGDEIVADRDHEWLVRMCGKREVYTIHETHELARKRSKRPMVRRAGPLRLHEADLPVDPYVLGVWLGDGHSAGMRVTQGDEDRGWMRSELLRLGYMTSDQSAQCSFGLLGVRGKFASLGLINDPAHKTFGRKHIPPIYLRASYLQRRALLQGLIDTDGTVCRKRGCTTFCNTNRELAEQVRELVRSLGVKAGWGEGRAVCDGKDCGPVYRVSFYMKGSARLPRKAELTRDQERTPNSYLEVEAAGRADTVCIEVDSPSHLFLCGRSMTPTHNSTYASVIAPAYFLGRHPQLSIIAASHTTTLAERFGRRARNLLATDEVATLFNVRLAGDSSAAGRWSTDQGGEYLAAGVGTGIAGFRADLGVIDDPVSNREQADSELYREKVWDWWVNDFKTRLKPSARVVLLMTRWHEDDLAGRLLEREPGRWKVLRLRMEAIEGERDPLGRKPGDRLWPQWFTEEMVYEAKRDARSWSALYQQDPRPKEGAEFKRSWLLRYTKAPRRMNRVMLVDPASGEEGAKRTARGQDFTSMWVVGLAPDGNAYVLDAVRERLNLTGRVNTVFDLHRKWKPSVVRYERIGMQADVQALRKEMEDREYRFRIVEVGGQVKKEDRIRRLIPWFENGRIWLPEAIWAQREERGEMKRINLLDEFIEHEYASFPVAKHDDMMDALARLEEPKLSLPWPREEDDSLVGSDEGLGVLDELTGY